MQDERGQRGTKLQTKSPDAISLYLLMRSVIACNTAALRVSIMLSRCFKYADKKIQIQMQKIFHERMQTKT